LFWTFGIDLMTVSPITFCTVALSVWRAAAEDATVTEVSTCPTSSATSTRTVAADSSVTFDLVTVRKPGFSTVTE
jgi:hypothetical protein